MLTKTITLGDGTEVTVTYTEENQVVSVTSNSPAFYFLFGPDFTLMFGQLFPDVPGTLAELMDLIYRNRTSN